MAGLSFCVPAYAWEKGEQVWVTMACVQPDYVELFVDVVPESKAIETIKGLIDEGDCFQIPQPWPAELVKPYKRNIRRANGVYSSIWSVYMEGIPEPVWIFVDEEDSV